MSADSAISDQEYPVLIAGGGLIGLSTAMFLAQHGISSLAVERLAAGSQLPRAAFFHMRTLEMFRSAGIEDKVREQSAKEFEPEGALVIMDTLSGKKLADIIPSLNEGVDALSPCRRLFCHQPGLEPILQGARARSRRAVLDGHEVIAVTQDASGVTMTVKDVESGKRAHAARKVSGRRRRRAQQGARAVEHSVRRARRVLQLDHDLLHGRPRAAAARQAAQRDLHQQQGARRLLPHVEGLPVGLPGREHRRRSEGRSEGCGRRRRRRERGKADRVRPRRRRRSRTWR